MSGNEKRVPKRRFKEFENAGHWEQRKVKEVCSISTGKSNTQDRIDDGIYPFYVRSPIIENSNRYLYDEEAVLTVGDGVGTGKVFHYVKGKYDLHQRVYRMFDFSKGTSGKYFYYYFSNHFYNRVMSMTAKTSVDSVRFEMISEMDIMLPSEKEQIEIKDFFDNLNHLIAIHQRKLNKMKALKEAYLTEIFPAEGERKPKLRFAGFTDDWEQRKLGTIAEFNPKAELPETFEYVDLESVVGTEMIDHREEIKATAPSRAQRLARQGDLFYQTVRPYQKNNYLFEKACNNYVFSTGYAQMRPYGDGYFLLSLVQNDLFVKSVLDRCTGTSYPAINSNDLADTEVFIPLNNNEQTRIGAFFKNIDNLITLYQRKLEKLQNIKKAYLNEMFI